MERETASAAAFVSRDLDSSGNLREPTRQDGVLVGGEYTNTGSVLPEGVSNNVSNLRQVAGTPRDVHGESRAASQLRARVVECDVCGTATFELHCRIICPRCGAQRDCSDP